MVLYNYSKFIGAFLIVCCVCLESSTLLCAFVMFSSFRWHHSAGSSIWTGLGTDCDSTNLSAMPEDISVCSI